MARVTVEDCLAQVPNPFALITLATQRARQIALGATPLVECSNKPAVTALREIAAGVVTCQEPFQKVLLAFVEERKALELEATAHPPTSAMPYRKSR